MLSSGSTSDQLNPSRSRTSSLKDETELSSVSVLPVAHGDTYEKFPAFANRS
jgi:hypothetical protein